jgi:hypothetical protein
VLVGLHEGSAPHAGQREELLPRARVGPQYSVQC